MKMALAGKFLSVFLFWGCAQIMPVMPVALTSFIPGLVAAAQAGSASSSMASTDQAISDLARPEPAEADLVRPDSPKTDSVRVLPDDFLSGNPETGRADSAKSRGKPVPALAGNVENGKPAESSGLPAEAGWDLMPAGAKPAYMGIHGGTMPVSLLVSNDGNSLLTFVGRTGNDFLDMLRRTDLPLPSLFNSTDGQLPRQVDFQAGLAGARVLSAGSGQARMPVLCLTTDAFARIAPTPDMLQPFGLSDKPLALEGDVLPPDRTTPAKQFRMFFQPQYLQPGANRQ